MGKPTFTNIQKLFRELVYPFYQIERDLPLPFQNHRNETDAEHSWTLAFMALCLAPEVDSNLNVGLCCRFAIVHDLVEVYAGDTSIWADQAELETKQAREAAALKKISREFTFVPSLSRTIETYELKNDNEALFIYALDKFIAALNLYEDKGHYFLKNKLTKNQVDRIVVKHRKKAHAHPTIATYYDELYELFKQHPEYFYSKPR